MENTAPMCATSSNAADAALCDVTFLTELMESCVMPASYGTASIAGNIAFCDVTFITELMDCDFTHSEHHPQHHDQAIAADHAISSHLQNATNLNEERLNAAVDVDPGEHGSCLISRAQSASSPHPYGDRHAEQFQGSHGYDDVIAIPDHVQNANNLHVHALQYREEFLAGLLASDFDGSNTDHSSTGVEADVGTHIQDAQHYERQSHDVDLNLIGPSNQFSHILHECVDRSADAWPASNLCANPLVQKDDIAEFAAHSDPHNSIGLTPCSSEDSLLRISSQTNINKEALLAALAEEAGPVDLCSDVEKLKHHEDLREKTHTSNLNLLHLLLACAEAVSEDNLELARVVITRLQELSCKYGSPLQRLSFYLCNALEARISPSAQDEFWQSLRMPLPPCDMLEAFCVFYNVNPIGRFCHLTLNQLILDNTVSDTQVHIIDLQIGYGMQWPAFLEAIALRPHGPPKVRLTAIGPGEEHTVSIGKKLMDMARALQVPFEYCPIASPLESFDVGMVDVRQDEVCVITSLGQFHTLLHKGSEFVDAFLAGLRSLDPKVLVLAENDVNHNDPLLLSRFVECLKYYAAVFESLDAALPLASQARLKIEKLLCGRKIGSIVACEGSERVERHETMHDWIRRLERAGFKHTSLTHTSINQAKLLLKLYYPNGYSLIEDNEVLTLQWNGAALMAIGIWH